MPLLSRKRIILAKIETTYGTDSVPTGAANAIVVRNLTITPIESDSAERDIIRPYLGASERLIAAARSMVEFECELMGSGTAGTAPQVAPLLRACGFAETISAGVHALYKPVSSGFESVTIYANVDGVLHKLTGARGNVQVELNNKQIPVLKFMLTGIFNAATDTALPAATYSSVVPQVVNNINTTAFAFQGYSGVMASLSIDMGINVVHRSLVGGAESVLITDRKASGQLQIEATTVAQKDYWTAARNASAGALTLLHGGTAGNRVQIDAPNVTIAKPSYAELDGIQMSQFDLTLAPSATGNDEITLTFK